MNTRSADLMSASFPSLFTQLTQLLAIINIIIIDVSYSDDLNMQRRQKVIVKEYETHCFITKTIQLRLFEGHNM